MQAEPTLLQPGQTFETRLANGRKLYRLRGFQKAQTLLASCIPETQDPNLLAELHYRVGRCWDLLSDPTQSLGHYQFVIYLNLRTEKSMLLAALAHHHLGSKLTAIRQAQETLRQHPHSARACTFLANRFKEGGDHDGAQFYQQHARMLTSTHTLEPSAVDLEIADVRDVATLTEAIYKRSHHQLQSGDTPSAMQGFDDLLCLNPEHSEGLIGLALCHDALKQPYKALIYIDKALRLGAKEQELRDLRARLYQELEDAATDTEAAPWLREAVTDLLTAHATSTDPQLQEEWKLVLSRCSPEDRRQRLIRAVSELRHATDLTLQQTALCLATLENIALSRRVTDLNSRHFYERFIRKGKNHALTLEAIELFLRSKHPEQLIITVPDAETPQKEQLDEIEAHLAAKRRVWLTVGFGQDLHKLLLLIDTHAAGRRLTAFDSLGTLPTDLDGRTKPYLSGLRLISKALDIPLTQTRGIAERRQVDASNCATLVIFDFLTAVRLINQQIPLFIDDTPHPTFFEISQLTDQREVPLGYQRAIDGHSRRVANIKTHLIALDVLELFLKSVVEYPAANYTPEGASQEDEIDRGCSIQ